MATRARPLDTVGPAYRDDPHAWAGSQASLIREGRVEHLDWENIAEEIESVGVSIRRGATSHMAVLLAHMLKWDHQPERRSPSWVRTIKNQRREFLSYLKDSPSLKPEIDDIVATAYARARADAIDETDLAASIFPKICPYAREAIFQRAHLFVNTPDTDQEMSEDTLWR